jgi:hypothetical protein
MLSSIATSSTLNVASGQLLSVTCYAYSNPGTITVGDTASANTFTPSPDGRVGPVTGALVYAEAFYAKNTVASATDTITCNFSTAAQFIGVMVIQASGLDTSSPLDTHATGTALSGNTVTSNSFSTVSANDIIVAGADWGATGETCSAGTNFTIENAATGGQGCDEIWITTTTHSSVTAAMTAVGGSTFAIVVMAYKKAVATSGHCAACDLSYLMEPKH